MNASAEFPQVIEAGRAADRRADTSIIHLADRIRVEALAHGFEARLKRSRRPHSQSCYLHLTLADRVWVARISDHHQPDCHHPPHVQLVSRDRESGIEKMIAWLADVASGRRLWWPYRSAKIRRRGGRRK